MKLVYVAALALLGVAAVYGAGDDDEQLQRQQRILAAYSTRTVFSMTTTTVTSLFTCGSAWSTGTCLAGRKMRRYLAMNDESLNMEQLDGDLSGSLSDDTIAGDSEAGADREGRIALTVWSTTTTPYTWTSTSTNTATTLSLSYWCSIIGGNYPPSCA